MSGSASLASNARVAVFGDLSSYYVRDVNPGLRIQRSDDLKFDRNQVAFRGLLRSDADLLDTNAVVTLVRNG